MNESFYETEDFSVPEGEKACSCCFTGHRIISAAERERVLYRLKSTVLWLVSKGITVVRAGGAVGFDTIAATTVLDLKRSDGRIKLVLELPYRAQAEKWNEKDMRIYDFIRQSADEVNYYGENPSGKQKSTELMLKRDRALVDRSAYCVCYLNKKRGGTAYTVDYAKRNDLEIINLADGVDL